MGRTLIVLYIISAVGCSGGGDGSTPKEKPVYNVSGVGYDGLILEGFVDIYDYNSRALEASTLTDTDGHYNVSIQVKPTSLISELSGGRYVEEASGSNVPLKTSAQHMLRAVYNTSDIGEKPINVTTWTNIAAGLAEFKMKSGLSTKDAISFSNSAISAFLGFPILETEPLDITNINNASDLSDGLKYGFLAGGLSQFTYNMSVVLETAVHRDINSINLSVLAYEDILADGLLDGKGENGKQLMFANKPLSANDYRHGIALGMVQVASNINNKTGITPDMIYDYANSINNSNSPLFGAAETVPLDSGASILSISPQNDDNVHGVISITPIFQSLISTKSVELLVNDISYGMASDPQSPVFEIDTTKISDCYCTFTFRVTNVSGQSNDVTVRYDIDNVRFYYYSGSNVDSGPYTSYAVGYDTNTGVKLFVNTITATPRLFSQDNQKTLAMYNGTNQWFDIDANNGIPVGTPIDTGNNYDFSDYYFIGNILYTVNHQNICFRGCLNAAGNYGSIKAYTVSQDYSTLSQVGGIDLPYPYTHDITSDGKNITIGDWNDPNHVADFKIDNGNILPNGAILSGITKPFHIQYSKDDKYLFLVVYGESQVREYILTGTQYIPFATYPTNPTIFDIYFSDVHNKLYALTIDGWLHIFDIDTSGALQQVQGSPYLMPTKEASPNSLNGYWGNDMIFDYNDQNLFVVGHYIGPVSAHLRSDGVVTNSSVISKHYDTISWKTNGGPTNMH